MNSDKKISVVIGNMQRKFKINEESIKKLVLYIIDLVEKYSGDIEINFISLDRIKKYNKEYRGVNRATDILSFNFTDIYSNDGGVLLIAPSWILKNNIDKSKISSEIALLIVHGILHLSGEDHPEHHVDDTPMGKKQWEILKLIPEDLKNDLVVVS